MTDPNAVDPNPVDPNPVDPNPVDPNPVDPNDSSITLGWMRDGTTRLLAELDGFSDTDLDEPSRLPGWSRRTLLAHVARNADALGRLLTWARTGVETPMYASPAARNAEIDDTAASLAPAALRDYVRASAEDLQAGLDTLTTAAWNAEVRTAQGRAIPAAQVPWMRVREVWIHSVDLAGSTTFADFPVELSTLLIEHICAGYPDDGGPSVRLVAADTGRQWTVGRGDIQVEAASHDLAAWLTGRAVRTEAQLPAWL